MRSLRRRDLLGLWAVGLTSVLAGCGRAAMPRQADRVEPSGGTVPPTAIPSPSASRHHIRSVTSTRPGFPTAHPGPPETVFALPAAVDGRATTRVALTIDDGYDPATVAAYAAFAQDTGIPITFNPNGTYAAEWAPHAEVLRPLIERGQVQIGNHTYSHANLLQLSDTGVTTEIERNEEWIQTTFGISSRPWFRPPYGFHDARTDEVAGRLGFTKILMWDGSFGDSRLLTPDILLTEARLYLTAGRIVLGHANHPTVTHLYPQLVELIRERHLQPVTLDEAFGTSRRTG